MTPKQQAFVAEYLKDFNSAAAARRAGYSVKTAEWQGPQLLAKPHVAEAVAAGMAARSERTKVDADLVLTTLAAALRADIADLYGPGGALKPAAEWPAIWRTMLVVGVESDDIYSGSGEDRTLIGHSRKVKLADRLRVLEMVGKHVDVQAWRERVGVDDLSRLSDAELQAQWAALQARSRAH